jgi:hypothetical protein
MSRIGPILGELISDAAVAEREPEHDEKQALEGFLEELRESHGIDFRSYKTPTIMRRLRRERDQLRARDHQARNEIKALHRRIDLLTQTSKRFAASMRDKARERQRHRRRLAAQYAVSRVLSQARNLDEAAPEILRIIGEHLGWEAGVLWTVADGSLRCARTWSAPSAPLGSLAQQCQRARFTRGEGLPGRVWARGEGLWVEDALEEKDPLLRAFAGEGLRGAIAFPVRDGGLLGVSSTPGRGTTIQVTVPFGERDGE